MARHFLAFLVLMGVLACEERPDPSSAFIETGTKESGEATEPVNSEYTIALYQDSLGWGYDILNNGKPYIHQPHIPAVPGIRAFSTEQNAQTAAELVLFKVQNNILPPTVSVSELDSLGVLDE